MLKKLSYTKLLPLYIAILVGLFLFVWGGNHATTAVSQTAPLKGRTCIIIDPGHGGEDGGATSCTGILESKYNLDISLRLNDLLHLLGMKTYMIRTSDRSIYTKGETIAQKKISDLHERVRIVNETSPCLLISIHQNHFEDPKYHGAQIFYGPQDSSKALAEALQKALIENLNPGSRRYIKKAKGIYLMEHIKNPGVLIECGFLSNPHEEAMLRNERYQKNLCSVIGTEVCKYVNKSCSLDPNVGS